MDEDIESHSLADMLQKSQVSVQPLLDEVMSAGKESSKVKGSVRLEDIEADVESSSKKEIPDMEQNKENIRKGIELPKPNEEMVAFNMLVEKMKSSGTLPEKPQPTVSCLAMLVIFKEQNIYTITYSWLFCLCCYCLKTVC